METRQIKINTNGDFKTAIKIIDQLYGTPESSTMWLIFRSLYVISGTLTTLNPDYKITHLTFPYNEDCKRFCDKEGLEYEAINDKEVN